ncbi:MAG TPA: lipopolysaccharide biosynthesis protein [Stellaceae bacterium]|nr:lipopolysaccharide biosynthesis protein [Stellaceae bacterium]
MLGTLALAVVNVLKLGLQLAVLPILARLLGPSAFGLVALAMPLILIANMLADVGLGNALVREKGSSRELESTIFWLSLLVSVTLAAIVSLLAWPMSRIMSQPGLTPIVIALTVILPIGGSLSVSNARISREGKFSLFAAGEVVATLVSSAAAIGAALAGFGPWSLVIQQCVLWVLKASWLIPASGFRPMLYCRPALVWPYLHFGLHSVGANLANLANKNLPTMVIGGLIGVVAAGHYSMAYQLVRVPELIISGPLYLSIFAGVAQWGDDRVGARPLVLKGLRGLMIVLAPAFCGLALLAGLIVKLLLGSTWLGTAPILTWLAPAGFFLCLYSFIGAALMGLGRSAEQFRLVLLSGVLLGAGTVIGARYGGVGVAAGFSLGAALAAPVYLRTLSRQLLISTHAIASEILAPIVATLAMVLAISVLRREIGAWDPWLQLVALVLCGLVSFSSVLAAISWRRLWEDLHWLLAANRNVPAELP